MSMQDTATLGHESQSCDEGRTPSPAEAAAIAAYRATLTRIRCETDGCDWGVSTPTASVSQRHYEEHLRTDPRHTNGEWIDRDGRERRGLDYVEES